MRAESAGLTVYYDGACPLCRKEIEFFRRRHEDKDVEWVDVSACAGALVASDLTCVDALARFHVRRADGELASGARGFAELWAITPGFQWLGKLAALPLMAPGFEWLYRVFLRVRPLTQRLVAFITN